MKARHMQPTSYVATAAVGLVISWSLGHVVPVSNISLVLFVWLFFTGLLAKPMIQGFARPFMNVTGMNPKAASQTQTLDILRTLVICAGMGFVIGDIICYEAIGSMSVGLLILGISTHIGTHHINLEAWFYQ